MIDENLCLEGLELLKNKTEKELNRVQKITKARPGKELCDLYDSFNKMTTEERRKNLSKMIEQEEECRIMIGKHSSKIVSYIEEESELKLKLDKINGSINWLEWTIRKNRQYESSKNK